MKKKMKGVASVESTSSYADSRIMFKHHTLMQDFDELRKETQAVRQRLESMKKKKFTLEAEVGFLRRRYKYLMKNQSPPKPQREKGLLPPLFPKPLGKKIVKQKTYGGNGPAYLRQQTPIVDFDGNEKFQFLSNGKELALRPPVPVFDSNQKRRAHSGSGKESKLHNLPPVVDLNQTARFNVEKETPVQNVTPAFDLNQVSMEEEEPQANHDSLPIEEVRKSTVDDEQLKDMKLSVCRNTGKGSSRAGKRKISWQDQVALRV